jgi:DNA-directed RNA polymerase specialized sigma24 family protein
MLEGASSEIDALLRPFLYATDEAESQHLLAALVTDHAEPIIRGIVNRKLHVHLNSTGHTPQNHDAEEIYGEALLQLIRRLRFLRVNVANKMINNFHSYVSVIAHTACYTYLRQKYPQRHRLKNRLRYILTHQTGFALWRSNENDWICGFVGSRDQKIAVSPKRRLHDLRLDPRAFEQAGPTAGRTQHNSLVHLITAVFKVAGGPVELDDLVDIVADFQGIKDQTQAAADHETGRGWHERFPDPRPSPASETEQRIYLQRMWAEICALPLDQRTALLLNLKDEQGRDITTLLSHIRIATLRQIAEALAITSEAFAELWNDLPLDDATIAKRLGLTRQQVISLRQSARRRLSRRMEAFSKGI